MMLAVPEATPVTLPLMSTAAMLGFAEDQVRA